MDTSSDAAPLNGLMPTEELEEEEEGAFKLW